MDKNVLYNLTFIGYLIFKKPLYKNVINLKIIITFYKRFKHQLINLYV